MPYKVTISATTVDAVIGNESTPIFETYVHAPWDESADYAASEALRQLRLTTAGYPLAAEVEIDIRVRKVR